MSTVKPKHNNREDLIMEKETVKAVLIQRGINTFDVEILDTTGRTRDLIIGGRTFDSLKEAELFIRRLED